MAGRSPGHVIRRPARGSPRRPPRVASTAATTSASSPSAISANGVPTGRTLDPQLGDVGALSITADGRDLVVFGAASAAISRWRLDGSGPITRHVADGYVVFDGWDPGGGDGLLVARRSPTTTRSDDFDDFALWDPERDELIDDLDFGSKTEGLGWAGPHRMIAWLPDDSASGV